MGSKIEESIEQANLFMTKPDGSYISMGPIQDIKTITEDPMPTVTNEEEKVETLNDHHRNYEFQFSTPSSIAKDLSFSFEQVRNNLYSALQRILIYEPLKIIQNGPAFIVIWSDGTKTVLKRKDGDQDDIYAAFGQALMIKIFGSNSHAHALVDKKFIKEEKKEEKNHE